MSNPITKVCAKCGSENVMHDAWCVWVRRDFIGADPAIEETFDSDDSKERDFEHRRNAVEYAYDLAAILKCEVEEY